MYKGFICATVLLANMMMLHAATLDLSQAAWRVQLKGGAPTAITLPGTLADAQ